LPDPSPRIAAVVVAGGAGSRFSAADGVRKQYRLLAGVPVLAWSLEAFLGHPAIVRTVVVLPPDDASEPPDWLAAFPVARVAGGEMRGDSVRHGLAALAPGEVDIVLVHDGARPLVSRALIDRVIAAAGEGAVIPGLPISDTVKQVDEHERVLGTLDRTRLRGVQTPQAFPLETLLLVHERAVAESVRVTDDAALFERYGLSVRVIDGDPTNLKVTTPLDLEIAEALAQRLPRPGRAGIQARSGISQARV
jgi:2-C-methyl-D-erythritol 4-phosphate cytidylyltransferase